MRIKLALRKEPILAKQAKERQLATLKQNTDTDKCRSREVNPPRSVIALQLKPDIAKKAKENQAEYHGNQYESGLCQKSDKVQIDTKKEVAKLAGVSHDTIAKVEKIEKQATPEVKADALVGISPLSLASAIV